jgi:hypothetical protein
MIGADHEMMKDCLKIMEENTESRGYTPKFIDYND